MDAGVQLGEALQQRGIVLDFQSRRAPGAAQSARGVHVAATSHQAVTVDLGRGQEFRLSEVMFLRALFTRSPLTAHEKSPQGSRFFVTPCRKPTGLAQTRTDPFTSCQQT